MKISIVGTGMVGSSYAYRLALSGLSDQIVLVDINQKRANAEMLDIAHASVADGSSVNILSGDYDKTENSDIVVITAGANQKPGQTRLDLIEINTKIMQDVIKNVIKFSPKTTLIIASNPLDVMSYAAYRFSGLESSKVIGSGTVLDTNRMKYHVAQKVGCNPQDVQGFVLGEHGDSQVKMYSDLRIQTIPLNQYCATKNVVCDIHDLKEIDEQTTHAAYSIIEGKGATYYGIASALFSITKAIVLNEKRILPVSVFVPEKNIYCALPSIVSKNGIEATLKPHMNQQEKEKLENSMEVISKFCTEFDQKFF